MNILNRLTTGISVVIIAACCVVFGVLSVSGSGWQALTVPTGSMRPSMPPGSLALVHSVPDNALKVGDVITYANPIRPSTTLSHRIVKKILIGGKIPGFVTKGDANTADDIPIVAGLVHGKVVWHASRLGTWLQWSKTWTGLAALVYAPALLIILEEVFRLNSYYRTLEPYRLFGYRPKLETLSQYNKISKKLAVGLCMLLAAAISMVAIGPHVAALMQSKKVELTQNTISVAPVKQNQCSSNTNIAINNSSTQTAGTGSVGGSENTNGGSATSGSASNSNSTTVNITVTNCP